MQVISVTLVRVLGVVKGSALGVMFSSLMQKLLALGGEVKGVVVLGVRAFAGGKAGSSIMLALEEIVEEMGEKGFR